MKKKKGRRKEEERERKKKIYTLPAFLKKKLAQIIGPIKKKLPS